MKRGRLAQILAAVALASSVGAFSTLAARSAWVNDDAFITFRYAQNLANGDGFVWNPQDGKRVEGSSSLAWTALNALALRAGSDMLAFSHRLGWLAGASTLVLLALALRVLPALGLAGAVVAGAFLALQRQWITWSVSGMETSAAAMVTFAATLILLRETRPPQRNGFTSGALFFLGSLLRPETPLLHLAALAGIAAGADAARPWRALRNSGIVHAGGLLVLTLVRLLYFGQPLPNTFYAKAGAPQVERGLEYLGQCVVQNHAWVGLLLVLVSAPLAWRSARAASLALILQIAMWSAWIVVLGGGRWEFRFFVSVLPACALLLGLSLSLVAGRGALPSVPRRGLAALAAAALLGSQALVLRTPFRPFDDVLSKRQLVESVDYMTLEASLLAPYLTADERVCTGWAGAFPFFTGVWHYDPWGLNEPSIAHRPRNDRAVVFHQRHATWQDVVDQRVQFVDVFNHFLFPRPFEASRARNVTPWTQPGIPVYSVLLPQGHYWLFASTLRRDEIDGWLGRRGLRLHSVVALPGGWPLLGQ